MDPVGSGGVLSVAGMHGGALGMDGMHGGALSVVSMHGGVESCVVVDAAIGIADLSPSFAVLEAFHSLVASSSFPDLSDTISLPLIKSELLAFHASAPISFLPSHSFDLSNILLLIQRQWLILMLLYGDLPWIVRSRVLLIWVLSKKPIFHLGRRLLV